MTKVKVLQEIGLKELIKTEFKDMITIRKFSKGTSIFYEQLENFNTYYIIEGRSCHIINTPEGGKFYRDFFQGEIPGLNFSLSIRKNSENYRLFDVDINFEEDSVIAYIPLEKIIDLEFIGKCKVIEKLMLLWM